MSPESAAEGQLARSAAKTFGRGAAEGGASLACHTPSVSGTASPARLLPLGLPAAHTPHYLPLPHTPSLARVDHIFLVSGNRAELLIKCEGEPGDRFIVASGAMLSPFGRASFTGTSTASTPLEQPVVMTIELSAAEGPAQPQPKQKACTPLRPGYGAHIRVFRWWEELSPTPALLQAEDPMHAPPPQQGSLVHSTDTSSLLSMQPPTCATRRSRLPAPPTS